MSTYCHLCGKELTFRDHFVFEGKDTCKNCLSNLVIKKRYMIAKQEAALIKITVQNQIRRHNRNLLLVYISIVFLILVIPSLFPRYFYNVFLGPFKIFPDDLVTDKKAEEYFEYYVEFKTSKLFQTGVFEESIEYDQNTNKIINKKVTAIYKMMEIKDKMLVIKFPVDFRGSIITGTITKLPDNILEKIRQSNINSSEKLLPIMIEMSVTNFRFWGHAYLFIGITALLYSIARLIIIFTYTLNITRHQAIDQLKRFGLLDNVIHTINTEIEKNQDNLKVGSVLFLKNWILCFSNFNTQIIHTKDIIWIYTFKKHYYYKIFPVLIRNFLVIWDNFGKRHDIEVDESDISFIIDEIFNRNSDIFMGFDKKLKEYFTETKEYPIKIHDIYTKSGININ